VQLASQLPMSLLQRLIIGKRSHPGNVISQSASTRSALSWPESTICEKSGMIRRRIPVFHALPMKSSC
jgi:hypothetical protein